MNSNLLLAFPGGVAGWTGFLGWLVLAGLPLSGRGQVEKATLAPAKSQPGEHAAAGREPALQAERDWVDDRWNRTEVGPFLASNLQWSGGRVAKGLSIKVGERQAGAVCFDTAACTYRAAWLGGFLRFDPARFGLIESPQIDGTLAWASSPRVGWSGTPPRYSGLHLHGQRVVLEYQLDGRRVLDSPWLEIREGLRVFVRSLELSPCAQVTRLVLADAGGNGPAVSKEAPGCVVLDRGTNVTTICVRGKGAELIEENGQWSVGFPAHDGPVRVKLLTWTGHRTELPNFRRSVDDEGELEALSRWLEPGPARWLPELITTGQRALDTDFLAVDTLTLPYDNPWKALLFLAGVDFTADGVAYVCSIHGDVWRVTGIDDKLGRLRWKRFATGLFQPLGLKVRDGQVFVLGRDQITRLHDANHDGEADFYENFCNLIETAPGHSYVTSLEHDEAGRFYYVDPRGAHRVSSDGKTKETLATGFRNPNGMGVSPDGQIITVAPQQGEWTPSSLLCEIRAGGFYGYGGPRMTPGRPLGYDGPLCWIPHRIDNSSGSQVWVPPDRWGPLAGHFLHLLWGRCGLMLVLRDAVDGVSQGAVVPLPGRFLSGPNRGSFNPRDGQLYVAGSTGWQTSAVKDGALHRVRFTGKNASLPIAWHAHGNGLTLTFAQPLEREAAEDSGSYSVQQWNYRYARQYGSKDWSVAHPDREGRDDVAIKSARLLADGRTVFLEMADLQPVMQMEIKYNLNGQDGRSLRSQLWLTLNRLDANRILE